MMMHGVSFTHPVPSHSGRPFEQTTLPSDHYQLHVGDREGPVASNGSVDDAEREGPAGRNVDLRNNLAIHEQRSALDAVHLHHL